MNPREVLERPFPPEQIRRRPGRNGEDVTYIESHVIIGRLNEAFQGQWSLVVEHHEILQEEVLVLVRLRAGDIEKMAFGGSSITRSRTDRQVISIVEDLKAAEADAVKRCARLLGVALTLHSAPSAAGATAVPREDTHDDNRFLSGAQLRAIHAIRRRLGWSEAQLAEHAARLTGSSDVQRLDKRAASTYIERLQAEVAPAGAVR